MSNEHEALKPCPFCGGEASPVQHFWWTVQCKTCGGAEGPGAESQAEAIAAWNTRTPDPHITQLEASNAQLEADRAELVERLRACATFIAMMKDNGEVLLSEGIHAGLRKGTDAPDSQALWSAIHDSRTTAWQDAIAFGLDPFFSMWGGDDALKGARATLSRIGEDGK